MKADIRKEILGGITTFLTMAYIVVVNPSILSTEGTGIAFSGALTATVLVAFFMTLLMGVYAKLPFAVAPGMGINAFFTYTVILGKQVPWPTALGMVFWAGILFLIISATPLRMQIARSIPKELRISAAVGIGLFLTFIGLKNSGIVVADPVTFVKLGMLNAKVYLALGGLTLMIIFMHKKNPLAFLIGIVAITVTSLAFGIIKWPEQVFSLPDFQSVFLKLDILGALKLSFIPVIFSIMMTDLFDSISTFVGVSHATGLVDDKGEPKNLKEGLIVDAWATLTAGLFGTSSGTAYIESAAGIEVGARTGKAAIVTAFCFLPCFFVAPLAGMVPVFATGPVLILVGALMFRSVSELKLEKWEVLIPSFLTIVLIPLTFSITQGILWGFISYVILHLIAGRRRELSPMLIGIAFISAVLLILEH